MSAQVSKARVEVPSRLASPLALAMLLFAAHGLNDQYNSYLGAMMPVLMEHFGMSLAMGGVMAAIQSLSTSLFQPVFGHMIDRQASPPSLFVWPIITAVSTCIMGFMPSARMLIPLLIVSGLSTAAFHPHASSLVPKSTASGLAMALFIAGGTFGYGIGPVSSLYVVERYGLRMLWVLAIPTVLVSLWALRAVPREKRQPKQGGLFSIKIAPQNRRILLAIWLIVVLRSTANTAFTTFMSVHLKRTGFPLNRIGMALWLFTMAGAIGSIAGGAFSDRFGRKTSIVLGLVGLLPAYWLFLRSSGALLWAVMIFGGFMQAFFNPVTVVMAQDLMPESRGAASGIIMGLGWSVGGFLVSIVGAAAEAYGLVETLSAVSLLLVPAIVISFFLPGTLMKSEVRQA